MGNSIKLAIHMYHLPLSLLERDSSPEVILGLITVTLLLIVVIGGFFFKRYQSKKNK